MLITFPMPVHTGEKTPGSTPPLSGYGGGGRVSYANQTKIHGGGGLVCSKYGSGLPTLNHNGYFWVDGLSCADLHVEVLRRASAGGDGACGPHSHDSGSRGFGSPPGCEMGFSYSGSASNLQYGVAMQQQGFGGLGGYGPSMSYGPSQ